MDCRQAATDNAYREVILPIRRNAQVLLERFEATCVITITEGISVAYFYDPTGNVEELELDYNMIPKCYGLLQTAAEQANSTQIQNNPNLQFYGQGVLLGFVDTGIVYEHPAFSYEDGSTRVVAIWDQTIQTGTAPAAFGFGSEYTKEHIEEALRSGMPRALVPSTDVIGHGTAMVGAAAGRESVDGAFQGVATLADIAMVKLKEAKPHLREYYQIADDVPCYAESDILLGVKYLYELAIARQQPLVLCIGVGTNAGSHRGLLPLALYLNQLATTLENCVVVAGGNEGNRGHHFNGRVEGNDYTEVELLVGKEKQGFCVELWGKGESIFTMELIAPNGEVIPKLPSRIFYRYRYNLYYAQGAVSVEYRLLERQTGQMVIILRFEQPAQGVWRLRVYEAYGGSGEFSMWLPIEAFISEETYFLQPTPNVTICEPGNAGRVLTTGTYEYVSGSLYLYSSRGYSAEGVVKPELAAPGVNVPVPDIQDGYVMATGSSIGAAVTAGSCALFFESSFEEGIAAVSTQEIKRLLTGGARRMDRRYPNNEWGYGALDVNAAFNLFRR